MSRLVHLCSRSYEGLRGILPLFGALVTLSPRPDFIASTIPGIGPCRSVYCKPVRGVLR
jgi:hypothetical protein